MYIDFTVKDGQLAARPFTVKSTGQYLNVLIVRTLKLKKGLFFEFNAPTIRKDEFSIL